MTVRCPTCRTVPSFAASDIGPDGRMVRCSHCGTRWLARSLTENPYARAALLPVAGSREEVADAVVIEEIAPGRAKIPPPPLTRLSPARRRQPLDRRLKALGVVLGVLAALVVLRAPIVAALPELKGLPSEVDLLDFQNVRSETVHLGSASTLFIEGEIVNRSAGYVDLPAIRVTLKSGAGEAVTSWLVEPSVTGLAAGGSIGFRSALASPPFGATQVTLALARRGGQVIGLR
ncbi:MAG: DUF3426 domain-containing protein [Bauldia sp.]|nr:DUF3426 domain-containing protein [Bauldia sp.]